MTTIQLDIPFPFAAPVDYEKAATCALIAGDPIHARDREAVVDAIRRSLDADGCTSANLWRPLIPAYVYSRVIGATVNALTKAGVLVPTGDWVVSDDVHGRNSGRPTRQYRWKEPRP